ncbi:uncharacterized protein [Primulina eburnea]|uniref:uncharacterized protein isoform X1 n=1 Tax=Primulina eburnea TaxID=1245227 RepID=UPI003C6C289B
MKTGLGQLLGTQWALGVRCVCQPNPISKKNGVLETVGLSPLSPRSRIRYHSDDSVKTIASIMPKELPGFYYDAAKNRYFPFKGPIPGSSSKHPSLPPLSEPTPADSIYEHMRIRNSELIQVRELCGNVISSSKGKLSFQAEYQKRHASQPLIWTYQGTNKMGNIALEHAVVDVTLPCGIMKRDILLSGGVNGLLCFFQVGKAGQEIDSTQRYITYSVWPLNLDQFGRHQNLLRQIGSSHAAVTYMPSDISCIKASTKCSAPSEDTMSKHLVITTLGSDRVPGSVYLLDLSKPLDFDIGVPIARDGFYELAAFKQTLWTIDCDPEGMHAVIGTNRGAALLNMETGASSWVFRCKSDVLSLQLNLSGNLILCGLRNGAIVTVDTRQKQINRNTRSSSTISMQSSVCCLKLLQLCDQYFFASSMDGSIKLYDHRGMQRGPVQSYDGNINSHTRIDLGVDPSEKVVMSGGEDCYLRLWDIKSGGLLFKNRFMNTTPSAVCWPRGRHGENYRCYWQEHYWGAWIGSYEGIFYMDWL